MLGEEGLPPVCAQCIERDGLCVAHAPAVLPQLKQPGWYRHAHSGMYHETGKAQLEQSPAAKKAERRNVRKKSRLERALAGEFTPVRPRAAA